MCVTVMDLTALRAYPFPVTQTKGVILIAAITQLGRREPPVNLMYNAAVLVRNLTQHADKIPVTKVGHLPAP